MSLRSSAARIAVYHQMLEPLRSREQVLAAKRADARCALVSAQQCLKSVEIEMADVAAHIRDLEDSIARARSHLDPHVMLNFPAELLRAVFLELADDMHKKWTWDDKFSSYVVRKAVVPFILASVCHRWRQVALDTSALWSFVAVPPPSSESDARKALLYVKTLLDRSGSSPIDSAITWPDLASASMPETCYSIVNALGSAAPRWRRISIDLPEGTDLRIFNCFRRPTPLLEEISVWYRPTHSNAAVNHRPADLQYLPFCPKLRRFRTGRCNIIFSAPRHSLAHLTHIVIWSDLTGSELWSILRFVPAVEHLNLWLHSYRGPLEASPGFQLDLPALQRLIVCNFAVAVFNRWASFLDAPRVLHIDIDVAGDDEQDNGAVVDNLLRQLSSSVVSLRLVDGCGSIATERAAEFAPLRNVRTVELHGWFESCFFERLVDDRAWPLLEAVYINPCDDEDFIMESADAILKLVRSHTVEVDSLPPGGDSSQLARLQSFSIVPEVYMPDLKGLSEQITLYLTP